MRAPIRELDTVVLIRDLPEAGLRTGDLGAVVHVYGDEAVEVEFVTASGRTQALLTLPTTDGRPVRDDDLLAVRTSPPVRGAASDDPETHPRFMEVSPVRMSERVCAGTFGHPALPPRTSKRALQTAARDRPALVREAVLKATTRRGREEPLARRMGPPVVAQAREEGRGQRHIAVAGPLAVKVEQHPATVNIGNLDLRAFEPPLQPTAPLQSCAPRLKRCR